MKKFLGIMFSVFVVGCTGATTEVDLKPLPVIPDHAAVVDIFSSYSCGICSHELPELHRRIQEFNEKSPKKVLVRLFLTGGKNGKNADDQQAAQYVSDFGLTGFEPHGDNRCRGQYQEYYPNEGCYVPAHVITSKFGEKLIYPQGAVNIDQFIRDLKESVGKTFDDAELN